ncbi:YslB family protein [uncultured Limosilactobacillus sp.]|uniref:YslB family protein n=1 Tax=uncultured Limosilactobacillus sp. TaxID=2837629 RepID=UPI0025F3E3E1|nr:YslB family protein [uncultured Limosilactobacillus sp.]
MTQKRYDQLINSQRGFISATLRDVILPSILGKETDGILYWIGKDLAREFPVASIDDLVLLTKQLGLGNLQLTKEASLQRTFKLSGPLVEERLAIDKEQTSFTLEAGFIAQELEFQLGTITEAEVESVKHKEVRIFAQNDPQKLDETEDTEIASFIKLKRPVTDENNQ